MKRATKALLAGSVWLAGAALLTQVGWADEESPEGSTGHHHITVSVTPTGTQAITISTHIVALGNQGLSTLNVLVATNVVITNSGTLGTDLTIQGSSFDIAGGGNLWTLVTAAPGPDQIRIMAILNTLAAVVGDYEAASDSLTTASRDMSDTAGYTGAQAANQHRGSESGDDVLVGATRNLRLKVDMPTASGSTAQHTGTITLTSNGTTLF